MSDENKMITEQPERTAERQLTVAYLRRCADECEVEWTNRGPNAEMGLAACEALREAATAIEQGKHAAVRAQANRLAHDPQHPTPPRLARSPRRGAG